jgi:hypothetical protein
MPRHTETGLAAAREILALLDKAERGANWNCTLLAVRDARRFVQELMTLNLTVPLVNGATCPNGLSSAGGAG